MSRLRLALCVASLAAEPLALPASANVCPSNESIATDATFDCLKSLSHYDALPDYPNYYFSSEDGVSDFLPQGDDANDCSITRLHRRKAFGRSLV